jgi:hypothetical protein
MSSRGSQPANDHSFPNWKNRSSANITAPGLRKSRRAWRREGCAPSGGAAMGVRAYRRANPAGMADMKIRMAGTL